MDTIRTDTILDRILAQTALDVAARKDALPKSALVDQIGGFRASGETFRETPSSAGSFSHR